MKISRYIYVPLFFGVSFALMAYFMSGGQYDDFIRTFIIASLAGLGLLFYNDYKVKKVALEENKEAFEVRQKRKLVVFANYDKTFDLCLKSVSILRKSKIKGQDKMRGIIEAKANMNWYVFGNRISYKLRKVTETMTEVELFSFPIPRTALLDYGEGWKALEDISNFLNQENNKLNGKHLNAKTEISPEVYTNSFRDKVRVN